MARGWFARADYSRRATKWRYQEYSATLARTTPLGDTFLLQRAVRYSRRRARMRAAIVASAVLSAPAHPVVGLMRAILCSCSPSTRPGQSTLPPGQALELLAKRGVDLV
jgi:hypothetical protein